MQRFYKTFRFRNATIKNLREYYNTLKNVVAQTKITTSLLSKLVLNIKHIISI